MLRRKRFINLMAVLVFCLGLGLLAMQREWFFAAAGILSLSLLSPWVGRKIGKPVIQFLEGLFYVSIRLLLGIFYLVVMLPWGLVYRLQMAALDRMNRKSTTLFQERKHRFTPADFERNR